MIRKHKKYKRPKQIFESERIKEENKLKEKYGLRNKTEIWKTQAKVDYFRKRAKALAKFPVEEQEAFFNKLRAIGLKVENTSDVLDLKVENILSRRLPTIVAEKKLADSPLHARQMIVHKHVLIDDKVMSAPSYLVPISQENQITIKKKTRKPKLNPATESEASAAIAESPEEESRAPDSKTQSSGNEDGDSKEEAKE